MIKKFIANSVEKAQIKARKSLGKNVVILNIRDLPSGDVEITAGDEDGAREFRHQYPGSPETDDPRRPTRPKMERARVSEREGDNDIPSPPIHDESKSPVRSTPRLGGIPFLNRRRNDRKPNPVEPPKFFDGTPEVDHAEEQFFTDENTLDYEDEEANANPYHSEADHSESVTQLLPEEHYNPSKDKPQDSPTYTEDSIPFARPEGVGSGSRLSEPMEQKFSENALTQLRERLTGQHSPGETEADDPSTFSIKQMLQPHGISDRLMTMIRNGARKVQVDDDLYRLGMGLSESFNFSPLRSTAAVPLMLVGPTGAGKTSCAAKLAALALAEGEAAIMITTDVGRAGALEQFATYSEKLNIECYAAETPDEIATIMHETSPQGAVILDTPGISPYDAGDLAALKSFQTAIGAEPVLVLPASGDVGEYTDWAHAFRAFGVRSCIITKFDATRRVGAGLSAAFEGNMTLTYFSETPFISEGLLPASPEFLAYRLTASYPGRIVQA